MSSEPVQFEHKPGDPTPFSTTSPKMDRLVDNVRSLELWYAADFERRISALAQLLKNEIRAEMKAQFSAELNSHVQSIRQRYEEIIYSQASQWESERKALENEIGELRRKVPGEALFLEIASSEDVLKASTEKASHELQQLNPDAASLNRLLQTRMEEMTLQAYIRGLKFRLEKR